jgi:hypothetical protein
MKVQKRPLKLYILVLQEGDLTRSMPHSTKLHASYKDKIRKKEREKKKKKE